MEEQRLIKRLKGGDEEAQREFINLYKNNVFRTCMGFVHNHDDAEDLTQEVFIKALQSISRFRENARLSTWLYRIAVNKSLNFIRDQKKKSLFQRIGDLFSGAADNATYAGSEINEQPLPDNHLTQNEQKRALQQALNQLPEKQRTAFILHKYEELSYTEIAASMQTTVASVESLMHRAKKNLQESLRNFYEKNMR